MQKHRRGWRATSILKTLLADWGTSLRLHGPQVVPCPCCGQAPDVLRHAIRCDRLLQRVANAHAVQPPQNGIADMWLPNGKQEEEASIIVASFATYHSMRHDPAVLNLGANDSDDWGRLLKTHARAGATAVNQSLPKKPQRRQARPAAQLPGAALLPGNLRDGQPARRNLAGRAARGGAETVAQGSAVPQRIIAGQGRTAKRSSGSGP